MKTFRKKLSSAIIATLLISASVSVLQAQGRPDTRYLTCANVIAIVRANGAVILSTGTHTYDKYVKNHAYCNVNESTKNAYVPTLDNRRCRIGYSCYDPSILYD